MADTVTTQTIADTYQRTVLILTNHSDGNGESSVVKVNAIALNCASRVLTLAAGANNFKIGETIFVANSTSNSTAIVADIANSTSWVITNLSDANAMFVTTAVITGATSGKTRVQSGAMGTANCRVSVSRMMYDVSQSGSSGAQSVKLLWRAAPNTAFLILSNSDDKEYAKTGASIGVNPTITTPNGDILITTVGFAANSTYSIMMELKKISGYQMPSYERNPDLGYTNDH